MDLDGLAELAASLLERTPVVLLGSGASIPHGLPSLPDLSRAVLAGLKPGRRGPHAREVQAFARRLERNAWDLERTLDEANLPPPLIHRIVEESWNYLIPKDISVRDGLLSDRDALPLSRLFRWLLCRRREGVQVVTTNWDRLAEYAADAARAAPWTGFSSGWVQRRVEKPLAPRALRIDVWKVHGSLDWFRDRDGEGGDVQCCALPNAAAVPPGQRPLIVTPGVTKYRVTHREPFRSVMKAADRALERAQALLCVGFGFNDEHVQPALEARLRAKGGGVPVVVLARRLTPAGRRLLLDRPLRRFLVLEEAPAGSGRGRASGTVAYHAGAPDGERCAGVELWSLPEFLDLLHGVGTWTAAADAGAGSAD